MKIRLRHCIYIYSFGIPALFTVVLIVALKPNPIVCGLIGLVMLLMIFLTVKAYHHFINSIHNLKYYISYIRNNDRLPDIIMSLDSEAAEVQMMIQEMYKQLIEHRKNIEAERNKLIIHIQTSDVGLAYFTSDYKEIYANSHFIQYLNTLLDTRTFDVCKLFDREIFASVVQFLQHNGGKNIYTDRLDSHGLSFFLKVMLFDDKTFEIMLQKLDDDEINQIDQVVMISNIAHELRTPVTVVSGYLETLLEHPKLAADKSKEFLERAYSQVIRLSKIIQDTTILSKTDTAPQYYSLEQVNLHSLLKDMIEIDMKEILEKNHCTIHLSINEDLCIQGNTVLLYSIFRNLTENAIKYAGNNVTISICNYMESGHYYYFSFADDGKGIEEIHFNRIFERFYRINPGRTRETGGSGLGLSIVKAAVAFHQGAIYAQNRAGGGLEFLFTLRKQ
ncbi:MAG: HAMP domain-containing histidine kinase [Candidatus Symbiothrix sp.]|jgi:signal transduction histidine kinase|nr:HAMP domain-containing histidine kinase [Candidatus Symbiothrix sp.]